MKCSQCEHENVAGQTFCSNCGIRLAAACPACGAPHLPGQKFCGSCGTPLSRGDGAKYAAPEAYTPKHLAEKILTSKRALEGERKQVTVLFADMKGSMELLAGRDPEEARRLLDPVLELMMEAVHRYEGMVNQVMGDGIMALFGAPVAHEDHAVRACYAALRMQEAARRYGEEIRRLHGSEVQLRVGLNSGDVVVRSMGNDLRMDYTAIGQTTHMAARMEQLAGPGTIYLTGDTLKLAEGYIEVRPLGPMPIKGLGESVDVYEIVGAGSIRRRFEAATARGLTRFVGREAELRQLAEALQRAEHGHGQIVAVVGEPGVGKSRLFHEFTRAPRTHGWLVLESGPASYVRATPYLPVTDLLKEYFQIEPADDARKIHDKVTGKLVTLDRALPPLLSPILALLDIPVEDPAWEALDPFQRRHRTIEAITHLLIGASRTQPLMLVVEDLHWIDVETQAVLDALIEAMPAARVLLLVNYRPEYGQSWTGKPYCTELRVDPLAPEHAEALLSALMGRDAELDAVTKLLTELTEGNPFFLEESVRMLVDTRILVREEQRYRLARPSTTIKVPATVQAVLVARIDRLSEMDKQLLQTAAVIGRHVPRALLQQVADLPGAVVHDALMRLQAVEFLYEATGFPDVEYVFRHALTQEVAYGTLLQARRRALHVAITEALERLYPERLVEHVELLAHHALAGQLWEKAVSYLRRAGIKAAGRSANRDAVERFEQALTVLTRLPETRQHLDAAMDLRIRLGNSFWTLGEFIPMHEHVRSAESLALALDDRRRLGQISASRSHCGWLLGDVTRAMEDGHRAMEIAEELGDVALQVRATYFVAQSWEALGQYRRAADLQRRIVGLFRGQSPHNRFGMAGVPAVWCRFSLAWCLAELGEFAEAEACAEEAIRVADIVDDALGRLGALLAEGFVALRAGRAPESLHAGERAVALCRSANLVVLAPLAAFVLGGAATLAGDTKAAVRSLDQAVRHAAAMNFLVYQPLLLSGLGEAELAAGRPDQAGDHAQQALRLARDRGERGYAAWALRQLAEIAAQEDAGEGAEAERLYREALAVADELGMRPLAAQCWLGLGRLARRRANGADAISHLSQAARMFSDMGLAVWLAETQRELGRTV